MSTRLRQRASPRRKAWQSTILTSSCAASSRASVRSASPRSQQPLSSLWHSRARDATRAARTSETLRPTAPPTASLSSHTSLTCFTCMLHALDSDSPVSLSLSLSLSLKTSRGPPLREVRRQVPNLRLVRAPGHPRAHLRRVQLRLIPGKVPYTFFLPSLFNLARSHLFASCLTTPIHPHLTLRCFFSLLTRAGASSVAERESRTRITARSAPCARKT